MSGPEVLSPQPRFYPRETFDHLVASRAIGEDFVESGDDLLRCKVLLYQLRYDFFARNQVDHSEVRYLNARLAQQICQAGDAIHHYERRPHHGCLYCRGAAGDDTSTGMEEGGLCL